MHLSRIGYEESDERVDLVTSCQSVRHAGAGYDKKFQPFVSEFIFPGKEDESWLKAD